MPEDPEESGLPRFLSAPLSRRQFLLRSAAVMAVPSLGAAALAACGGSDKQAATASASTSPSAAATLQGTAVLQNFPGWIGSHEIADFHKRYPQAQVKLDTANTSTVAGTVQLVKNNPGAYDLVLGDGAFLGQAKAAGIVETPDWSAIPNISLVGETYRKAFPDQVPNDYGFGVIGYRKDVIKEPITGWKDFWKLAPKYSGKVTLQDLDRATIGIALKMLGFSDNSTDPSEIEQAQKALIKIKPDLQAVTSINVSTGLAKGSIVLAHAYNFDIAVAQESGPDVEWVVAEEGTVGYIEGFVPVKGAQHPDVASAFLDFNLEPQNYADFINTTGSSWIETAAERYVRPALLNSPALKPTQTQLDTIEWTHFLGEATTLWSKAWEAFKAA